MSTLRESVKERSVLTKTGRIDAPRNKAVTVRICEQDMNLLQSVSVELKMSPTKAAEFLLSLALRESAEELHILS